MTAVKKQLDSNKSPCKSLPREITSVASKIRYCSHTPEWSDEITKALQEMIGVCQEKLDDLNSHKDEYTLKLQKRRSELANKLMKQRY